MFKNKKIYSTPILVFLIVILITAFLLKSPLCSRMNISYSDALFEATSNVTATGTNVVDVSEQFTFFGQLVILIAMEIGTVGIMLFFSLMFTISKKKLKLSDTLFLGNEINTNNYTTVKDKAKKIIKYTLVIEIMGAWLLSFHLIPVYGFDKGIWYSIFHAVSGFCNVGTDLFGNNSFVLFKDDLYISCVLIFLMFSGSLGFFVLEDLFEKFWIGKQKKMHIESKLIFNVTIILILVSTVFIKLLNSNLSLIQVLFSVVGARNTGFFTVDVGTFSSLSQFFITMIMFVGGSPGSNAGGIRIMVFTILILTTITNIRGREDVVIYYRNIPDRMIKKALTVLIVDLFIVFLGVIGLTLSDNRNVLDTLFYIVSCFSNTGLSTIDVTTLSLAGKWIAIIIMYFGKIAPITFVSLFIPRVDKKSGIKYPNMDVIL